MEARLNALFKRWLHMLERVKYLNNGITKHRTVISNGWCMIRLKEM